MKNKKQVSHKKGTGLVIHAATAAFTPARAVTSHLRKRFHARYVGRYRFAKLVFAFDMSMLALATFLAGLNMYLFTVLPAPIGDVRLVFRAPAIRTAEPLALEGIVTSASSSTREDVRLRWQLPPGTEILEATPPLNASGEAYLGDMEPGERVESRLVVRMFVAGDAARFGFVVTDRRGSVTGAETRRIEGSGLVYEPVIPVASVVRGASIPFRLKNTTALMIPSVNDEGNLAPYTEKIVFVQQDPDAPWRVSAQSRGVELVRRTDAPAMLVSDPTGAKLSLKPSGGTSARFSVDATRAMSVAVFHPGLPHADGHVRVYDVPPGHTEITVPVDPDHNDEIGEWFVIPFVRLSDGNALGHTVHAPLTTAFELHVAARYYASTGDQIGIGPLPPHVGQPTCYWVRLSLMPTRSDLADARVRLILGKNVRVTGRDALPDGGSFTQTDRELIWVAPYLPANSQGITASFEIELTPDASQKGSVPVLVNSASATATDQKTGSALESISDGVDADLPEDEIGKGNGTVR